MMRHALANGVKPNLTLSGIDLTPERAKDLAEVCGGIAVSLYEKDKETGYNAVKMLVDAGMQQVTVHLMVSKQTLPFTRGVLADYQAGEPRLQGITAFVFLSLKPKGRAAGTFDILPASTFSRLTRECLAKNIPFGFDSCSAPRFERALQYTVPVKVREQLMMTCESCESGLFSSYVSADGTYYPCSFAEGVEGIQGIKVQDHESFLSIWYHPEVLAWRENLLANRTKAGTRYCQIYKEIN
jgi:MoaA/NifB/PqqE/SkfB family radical SAM enzyme